MCRKNSDIGVIKRALIIGMGVLILAGVNLGVYVQAKTPQYVFYDLDNWRRYKSSEVPDCRHKSISYRYVEADKHSIFCMDCGIIFGYENCNIDNDYYCSPSDYYHDRCLKCLNKKEYVYVPKVKVERNYID